MTRDKPVAIISGGASGIGFALAKILAPTHHLLLIGRDSERLNNALDILSNEYGASATIISADITQRHNIKKIIDQTMSEFKTVDYVIAAAGFVRPHFFDQSRFEDHQSAMAVNYFGTISLINATLPYLQQQKHGRLILFSSACIFSPLVGYSAYTSSKSAVAQLGKTLSVELRQDGISVHVVYPPDTDTPLYRNELQMRPKVTTKLAETTGLWSQEDVAEAIMKGIEADQHAIIPARLSRLDALFASFYWSLFAWWQSKLLQRLGRSV